MTNSEKMNYENNDSDKEGSYLLAVFDILLNFSSVVFYLLLGLVLDGSIKVDGIFFFLNVCFFFAILMIKAFYKKKKIKDFLEWRNVNIQ